MKQKRYWLKGGLTGLIVAVFFLFVTFYIGQQCGFVCMSLINPWVLSMYTVYHFFPGFTNTFAEFVVDVVVMASIIWFCLGAIIGWVYGKSKNKDSGASV